MSKKAVKITARLLVILMTVMMFTANIASANGGQNGGPGAVSDPFDTVTFKSSDSSGASKAAQTMIGSIIAFVQVVGMGVAIIMLIVMAIKYISAAPSEKAEIKKSIMIYVVGAIVLFAATGILQIVKNFAGNIDTAVNSINKT